MTLDQTSGDQTVPGGLTRRRFIEAAGVSAVSAVAFTGCEAPQKHEFQAQSRVRVAEDVLTSFENYYATTCRQCGAGCGLLVRVVEGRSKKIEGNPDHPVNRGKVCARGLASVQEQYHPDRLQGPMKRWGSRDGGGFDPITWDQALNELTGRLKELQSKGRSRDVVVVSETLVGHQQLIAERFARSFGSQWMTFDSIGEAPLRAAARRVFGQDLLPEFDLQNARFVLSFGADFLGTWLSPVHYGVEYGVFRQGSYRARDFQPRQGRPRGYFVQVEPRLSLSGASADQWLPVRPGTEGILALGLAHIIATENLGDADGVRALGGAQALGAYDPDRVARDTGLKADQIRKLAHDFAAQRPSVALGGGPAGAQTNGTDTLTAVLALNVVVGNVGRPGGVRLNPAATLAGAGIPASKLGDWQTLADRMRGKQVEAALIHNANPVHGLPTSMQFRAALQQVPWVVSFSSFIDDTSALADLILPSHLPLEEWGDSSPDPGPGFEVLSIQQPVVRPLYDTRSFWDVLLTVGEELGGATQEAMPWRTYKEVLRDRLGTLQREGRGSVREADFERFWNKSLQQGGWWDESRTATAVSAAPSLSSVVSSLKPAQFDGAASEYPFHLVVFPHLTLGAGETAHIPWLQGTADPLTSAAWQTWVEVNPKTAAKMSLVEGDIVRLQSPRGQIEVPVYVHPAAPPDVLGVPLGQGHVSGSRWELGSGPDKKRGANPMDLVAPLVDETSGALAYAATRVKMTKMGRHISLPKYEGNVPAYPVPHEEIAKVTGDAT